MFNGNFKENQENQHEIQIGGVSDSALVSIIDYFYTGSVIVTMDNAEELLEKLRAASYDAAVKDLDFWLGEVEGLLTNEVIREEDVLVHQCLFLRRGTFD